MHGSAPGERHIAISFLQAAAGHDGGDQRSGAGCLHTDGRPPEVELESNLRCNVVLLVAGGQPDVPGFALGFGERRDFAFVVRVVFDASVDSCSAESLAARLTSMLQRVPSGLQQHTMLRVGHFGFHRTDAEESRIQTERLFYQSSGTHIKRIPPQLGWNLEAELVFGQM